MGRDKVYFRHILDAILQIEEYLKDVDFESFQEYKNKLIQDGVVRELEIIGEAAKNISAESRNSYDEIPWKDITGMRDKLIHGYFGLDFGVVWRTAKEDLPNLKAQVENIIAEPK